MDRWLWHPREIEHDLEVYNHRDIGDWFRGTMSSRKLLMYIDGLLGDSRSVGGWYGNSVIRDLQEKQVADAEQAEREIRAVNKAEVTGQSLKMSDLQT